MAGQLGLEAVIVRGQGGESLLEATEAGPLRQQTPDLAPPGLGHPHTHLGHMGSETLVRAHGVRSVYNFNEFVHKQDQ